MGRIMAIDYGLKRVGLAVTDPLQIIPTALDTIPEPEVLKYIQSYCLREMVDAFVLGEPKNLDNSPSEIAPQVNAFGEKLKTLFPDKKLIRLDERFTSKMASQALFMAGYKKKDRQKKENIDKISAVILLQNYLEIKLQ